MVGSRVRGLAGWLDTVQARPARPHRMTGPAAALDTRGHGAGNLAASPVHGPRRRQRPHRPAGSAESRIRAAQQSPKRTGHGRGRRSAHRASGRHRRRAPLPMARHTDDTSESRVISSAPPAGMNGTDLPCDDGHQASCAHQQNVIAEVPPGSCTNVSNRRGFACSCSHRGSGTPADPKHRTRHASLHARTRRDPRRPSRPRASPSAVRMSSRCRHSAALGAALTSASTAFTEDPLLMRRSLPYISALRSSLRHLRLTPKIDTHAGTILRS